MSNNSRTEMPSWKALEAHHDALKGTRIADLFAQNPARFSEFSAQHEGLLFDYSKTLSTSETLENLIALAKACDLEGWRDKLFSGEKINNSEDRAALHTLLRTPVDQIEEADHKSFIAGVLDQIKTISTQLRESNITDVINIGIGGSDIGPHMACEALIPFADGPRTHFVSNIDGAHLQQTLAGLKPENTVFIISSKTFTTLETLTNARSALAWAGDTSRFYAVTTNAEEAQKFGIEQERILPLKDWIGGRYSVWSAIGLSLALQIGFESFERFLAGAHSIDQHFKTAPLDKNIPVLMALIGIWHRNFCDYDALAILPYAENLNRFPRYIAQLDMESNGKSMDREGRPVDYKTSPVVFGEAGTDGQHAFFQLLHQGTEIIPCDFVIIAQLERIVGEHHNWLLANAIAQTETLMHGNHGESAPPHQTFPGNRPSTSLVLDRLDPYHLGMLMALYEHKIFVQGALWNINSFDQWGVELGKKIAKNVYGDLKASPSQGAQNTLTTYIRNKNA